MKKYVCEICGTEKSAKDAACEHCGKVLFRYANVGYAYPDKKPFKIVPCMLYITDKHCIIAPNDVSVNAFGLVGALIEETLKPKDSGRFIRYSPLSDITDIAYPIEKYGSLLNGVQGDRGIRLGFQDGVQIVLRLPKAKVASSVVALLRQPTQR